jgi:hypothetical protein
MSRSRASTELLALKSALAAVDGSGAWTIDLSATGAVTIGKGLPLDGPNTAVVLGAWTIRAEPEELTAPKFIHTLGIAARRIATGEAEETRLLDALDLADNIARALLGTTAIVGLIDPVISFAEPEDADPDMPGVVVVLGEFTYASIVDYGSGV